MNRNVWVDPRIKDVQPNQMQAYLLGKGWHREPFKNPKLLVFGGFTDDAGVPFVQVLPASGRFKDYLPRLEELLAALSIWEDRHPVEILNEILAKAVPDSRTRRNGTVKPERRGSK